MSQEAAARAAMKSDQEFYWCGVTDDRLFQFLATFLGENPANWGVAAANTVCLQIAIDRREETRIRLQAALAEYTARAAAHK